MPSTPKLDTGTAPWRGQAAVCGESVLSSDSVPQDEAEAMPVPCSLLRPPTASTGPGASASRASPARAGGGRGGRHAAGGGHAAYCHADPPLRQRCQGLGRPGLPDEGAEGAHLAGAGGQQAFVQAAQGRRERVGLPARRRRGDLDAKIGGLPRALRGVLRPS